MMGQMRVRCARILYRRVEVSAAAATPRPRQCEYAMRSRCLVSSRLAFASGVWIPVVSVGPELPALLPW